MKKGFLRLRLERVDLPPPITKNFERYLLQKQVEGSVMLSFVHEEGGTFLIYFGEIGEGDLATSMTINNIEIAPWRLYIFNAMPDVNVDAGQLVCSIRLVDEYTDVMQIGDPVELVDISTQATVGTAQVVALHKFKLDSVSDDFIEAACSPRAKTAEDICRIVEYQYEQRLNGDETVTAIQLLATSPVSFDTRMFHHDDQQLADDGEESNDGLFARIIKRLRRV